MARMTRCSIVLAGLFMIVIARPLDSCSFWDPAVLQFEVRPDDPIEKYLAGNLGLVRPSFARSHLVIAYRYMSGRPLNADEQRGVAELMAERLPQNPLATPAEHEDIWKEWTSARLEAAPDAAAAEKSSPYRYHHELYASILNCTDDAFVNATATLKKRIAEFGAGSDPVRAWVLAQDAVFANCSGVADPPAPADAELPLVIRQDREYQIASAHFYREEFEDARQRFLRIAGDGGSPWAALSRFVAARALVRDATLHGTDNEAAPDHLRYNAKTMVAAEREVRQMLADPKMRSLHRAAKQLLNFIEIRLRPAEYTERVAGVLARGESPSTIHDDLADYTVLLDDGVRPTDEMTDWIFTLQGGYEDDEWRYRDEKPERKDFAHAVEQWQKRKSTLWLVPVIVNARPEDDVTPALLKAAHEVGPQSPAYMTVRYHRLRLLRAMDIDADVRSELDQLLETRATMGPSTRNALLEMRLPHSTSIDEFVRDAARDAAGYALNEPIDTQIHYLGDDAVNMMNRSLRVDDLASMVTRPLPGKIPAAIVVAAWTRALLLGRPDLVKAMTPLLAQHHPEVAPALERYAKASPADRRVEGINILVHYPGLTPYVGGTDTRAGDHLWKIDEVVSGPENWWCADSLATKADTPEFANEEVRRQAAKERLALVEAGAGPTYVLRIVVRWAKERPADPRLPEALARAIATTRWSCGETQTRAAAATAFKLLHAKYGKTKWAKETRYWYDGQH